MPKNFEILNVHTCTYLELVKLIIQKYNTKLKFQITKQA